MHGSRGGHPGKQVAEAWDALVADGWKPSDAILEVREACEKGKE